MSDPVLEAVSGPAFQSVRERLDSLGAAPPQVLLLEGGSEAARTDAALYWACRCSCPSARQTGTPCLSCPTCRQIAAFEYLDLIALDGRISNKEDKENPGKIRALSMDNVRGLKSVISDPPHNPGFRVVILAGIETTRTEAANALLKAPPLPRSSSCSPRSGSRYCQHSSPVPSASPFPGRIPNRPTRKRRPCRTA